MNMPKVAIIYLCWSDEPKKYLSRALDSITSQSYSKDNLMLIVVYNGPRDIEEPELHYIKNEVKSRENILPETIILEPDRNIGFSAGNNFGAEYAVNHGADYVFFHNADGFLGETAVSELVKVMEADKTIGECQPLILLYPEKDLINSAGNHFHYLGIGYCADYRANLRDFPEYLDVGYVSGAAAFMRAELLKKYGYWNDYFYLYHEDTEYSLRLKLRGFRVGLAGKAFFYHQYSFSNKTEKFFWIERNRHALKIIFYRWPTLFLLLPLEILYNMGLTIIAAIQGWHSQLFKVYKYWLTPANWSRWLAYRRSAQKNRKLSDSALISSAAITVGTGDLRLPPVIRICVNFVFTIYWILLKILIWW